MYFIQLACLFSLILIIKYINMKLRFKFFSMVLVFTTFYADAQLGTVGTTSANSSFIRGWTDPALNHNALLKQKTADGGYTIIGNFKVKGSPFLYGLSHKGNMFSPEAKAYNINLNYNTYNQELEFTSNSNPDKPLIKEPGTIDSFTLLLDVVAGITSNLDFVYGATLGSKDKAYFQKLYEGPNYSVYKKYKSELNYVSDNYIQSELREYELQVEYYYKSANAKGLKKIKPNAYALTKEFKDVKDLSSVVTADDFSINTDAAFKKAFEVLNN